MSAKDDDESPESNEGGGFSGLLKKAGSALKNAVIEPDENDENDDEKPKAKAKAPAKAPPAPVQRPSFTPPPTPGFGPVPSYPVTSPQAAIDQEFAATLEKETAEAAKPAFTAFEAVEQSMRQHIPNDMQRIQAAAAAVGVQGHTLPAILFDVDECLQAIDKREQDLRVSFEKKTKERVGGLEQKAEGISQAITAKNAEIVRLQQEVAQMESERQQTLASVGTEKEKLTNKLNSLLATIQAFRAKWQAVKQNIKANTGA